MFRQPPQPTHPSKAHYQAVVIGGSAGSIDALGVLLSALPASLRASVLVVLHLPRNRPSSPWTSALTPSTWAAVVIMVPDSVVNSALLTRSPLPSRAPRGPVSTAARLFGPPSLGRRRRRPGSR